MINNIDNNVIDFKSFKSFTRDNTSKDNNKEYIVTLYENKQYKFVVSANSGEEAENIISKQYEEESLNLNEIDVFTFETLAVENNV
jgi:hypothetical protein|tara:strand:+ start:3467 stop:3724 length:258 start_codon:yes stop_codon:yes gene_type:complete